MDKNDPFIYAMIAFLDKWSSPELFATNTRNDLKKELQELLDWYTKIKIMEMKKDESDSIKEPKLF